MSLDFAFTADNRNFMNTLHEITSGVDNAARQIEANGGSIDRVISMIKTGVASIGIGLGFKELVSQVSDTRDQFQKLEIAFTTFLGSEEEANKLMQQMVHTAAITPFDLAGVADGAKNLLAFGVAAEDVNKTIIGLGDIAAGLSQPLGDIIYLYGTTITKPKMDTQDLMQMMGRGIPIAKELAKQFGVAENKVRDLISAGKVTGDAVKKAFESMTAEGSMFGGLMEAQSKSIGGQIANIEDAIDEMFNEIGKSSEGLINLTLEATSSIVENWRSVLLILGDIAAAYGVQKALLALDSGFTKVVANYGYDAEIEQLRALIPMKEEESQTSLQQAVASGELSEAKAAEIMALREEAQAQLQALEAKEAAAKAEEASAIAIANAAEEEVKAIDEEIGALWEKISANRDSMTAEELETAATELDTLETMRNEAANIANAASEEARAAAVNSATASEEREILATQISTAQTSGNTAATGILTIAKEKLAIAIGKVNAMLKANQFALITGAVIALGYAIYKLATYQSEEEKMASRVKDATDKVSSSYAEEKKKLDALKEQLESSTKGSEKWKSAKDALISQYGQYDSKLAAEIDRVGTLTTSYDRLTTAIRKSIAAKGLKDFNDANDKSGEREKDFAEWYEKEFKGKLGENTEKVLRPILDDFAKNANSADNLYTHVYYALTQKYGAETGKKLYNSVENDLKKLRTGDLSRMHQDARQEQQGLSMYMEANGIDEDTANEVLYGMTPSKGESEVKDKSYWTDKKKEAQARLDALDNIAAAGKEGGKIKAEIEKYDKIIAEYSTNKNKTTKSSGPTAEQIEAKEENAQGKIADLLRKQAEERLRIEQDYEYERWQSRIDLMDDGEKKVIAQMKLDNSKERTELDRRKKSEEEAELQRQMALFNAREDALAASNKKYAKKTFRDSDIDESEFDKINERYEKLYTDLDASQKKAETDRLKSAKESMNVYLKEFGSYQDKRVAIQEEYEKKILESQNDGERLQAIANRNKALADLDFNEWKENGGMSLAFGDIEKLSKQTITGLIADMEKYRSKIISTFDPDKIKTFEDTLNNLRMAEVSDSFFVDDDALSGLRERLAIQKQIADEEANEAELKRQMADIEFQLATLNVSAPSINLGYTPDGENIESKSLMSDEDIRKADELRVMLDAASQALEKSTRNSSQLKSQLDNLGKVKFSDIQKFSSNLLKAGSNASDLASIFSDDLGDAIGSATDKMGTLFEAFTELSSNIESLAKAGKEAVKKTADASATIVEGASEGMKASASATSASLSTLEKASAILAIIGAAIQLATIVASLFDKDKKHEKNIKALQDQIDALERSYDRLGKAADEAFSTDASNLINQQNTLLQQQKVLIKQQMAEEEAKKKTDSDKIKQYKEQLEDIDDLLADNAKKAREAIIGEDLKSAINEFASLYADAWNDGTDAAQKSMAVVKNIISSAMSELLKKNIQPATERFYNSLAKAMEDGVLTDAELDNLDVIKREIDSLASSSEEQWKKIQDRYKDLDELKEELTDISFDSVRDNFKSLLSDMESTTADFTNSFSDMLRNALLEGLMSEKYDLMLKEWYDEFADAMNDRTLTDSERDALRQQYDAIVQQGLSDRDLINSIVGGGAYSQEVTKGGWATMGQDQADELNGRFTALTELEAINNSLVGEGNIVATQILDTLRGLAALTMTTEGDDTALRDIRDMMFLSTGYLEDISKYTKQLITIRDGIERLNDMINERL